MARTSSAAGPFVVVIGGGVIGLTIARALALRGVRDICLIEEQRLGTEASFAAGGMLAPQAEADAQDDFFESPSESRSVSFFAAALREETGIDVELDTTGTLYLAFTEQIRLISISVTSGNQRRFLS